MTLKKLQKLCIFPIMLLLLIGCGSSKDNIPSSNEENNTSIVSDDEKKEEENENINRFEGLTLTNENVGVPVLYYHSVDPSERNEVTISPEHLKEQLEYIKSQGYVTLTMTELMNYILDNKEIPEKSIVITFDDGYMDNYNNAYPILKELDMKATIFVIANGIDDGYYLSSEQLKEMSDNGIDIVSHTFSHPYLTDLSYDEQLKEFKDSKEKIEGITGKDVFAIAYPFGYLNDDSVKAAKEAGYKLAFTTDRGYADRDDDPLKLNRIYVSSYYSMDTFKEVLEQTEK